MTAAGTRVSGKTTKCMATALLYGKMDASTMESIKTTKSTGLANSNGLTEGGTRASGGSADSMAKACTSPFKAKKSTVSGKTASEPNG